jgi:hypothetical protein
MTRIRFSIASLLGLVLFVAIAVAALRAGSEVWDQSLFSATLAVLVLSVLLALNGNRKKRAYWLGFALFGGAYLLASLVPPVAQRLLTTQGLTFLDSKVPARGEPLTLTLKVRRNSMTQNGTSTALTLLTEDVSQGSKYWGSSVKLWDAATGKLLSGAGGTSENFIRIGHTLIVLVLAFLGGHASRYLYTRNRLAAESHESTQPPTNV